MSKTRNPVKLLVGLVALVGGLFVLIREKIYRTPPEIKDIRRELYDIKSSAVPTALHVPQPNAKVEPFYKYSRFDKEEENDQGIR
jgi:hypothetical protein